MPRKVVVGQLSNGLVFLVYAIALSTLIAGFFGFVVWLGESLGVWMLYSQIQNSPLAAYFPNPADLFYVILIFVWVMSFVFSTLLLSLGTRKE